MFARIRQFFSYVIPAILRPLRTLWNEVVGFVFLGLAALAIPSAIRTVREFNGDPESFFRVILAGLYITIMTWFGVTSFLRARKISRS